MANREYNFWEDNMLSEYLAIHHPAARVMTRVRLGSVPAALLPEGADAILQKVYGNIRLWADAVAIYPERLILIEAKIKPKPGVISTMEIYARYVKDTPELKEYLDRPMELELVYVVEYPMVIAEARSRGIRCVQFLPSNLNDLLKKLPPREATSPLPPLG